MTALCHGLACKEPALLRFQQTLASWLRIQAGFWIPSHPTAALHQNVRVTFGCCQCCVLEESPLDSWAGRQEMAKHWNLEQGAEKMSCSSTSSSLTLLLYSAELIPSQLPAFPFPRSSSDKGREQAVGIVVA